LYIYEQLSGSWQCYLLVRCRSIYKSGD